MIQTIKEGIHHYELSLTLAMAKAIPMVLDLYGYQSYTRGQIPKG